MTNEETALRAEIERWKERYKKKCAEVARMRPTCERAGEFEKHLRLLLTELPDGQFLCTIDNVRSKHYRDAIDAVDAAKGFLDSLDEEA